jgi:hypothetical protein
MEFVVYQLVIIDDKIKIQKIVVGLGKSSTFAAG